MKYKKYFRKTSLKQRGDGDFFLKQIEEKKPKTFLEIGVFHGVTARNVCELLHEFHGTNFKYIGLDLFETNEQNKNEIIPNVNFSNPLKKFFFKYIKRQNPYSLQAVQDLLKKYKNNVSLIKGNSNHTLRHIEMGKVDYVFLDGGHEYQTVKNDLNNCKEVIINLGTVLCDDYNLSYAPGVKKAIDEFVKINNFKCEILHNSRFAKIEKY